MIANVSAEIRIKHLPDTIPEICSYTILPGVVSVKIQIFSKRCGEL
jgi:hypothetical protein